MPQAPIFSEEDSVKERVLQNIVQTMQEITTLNGYAVDIAQVLRFRIAGYDTIEYPVIMVVGPREDKTRLTASPDKNSVRLSVTLEVLATDDALQDAETYHDLILRDMEAALMVDPSRGGIARNTDVNSTSFTVVAQQLPYATSIMQITVQYQHDTADPTKAR